MNASTLGGWLVHVMREADGSLSFEEALHVIMDSMKEYFPSQSVAVILIDDDTSELRIKISRQISYTFVKKFHRAGPSPTAERVVLEQQPILLNNLSPEDPMYKDLKLEHDFSSAVLAPIVTNKRGVGYVFCDRANGEKFTDPDLLHLQVLGYLIGNLLEKFDLISASKKLSQIDDATKALQYKAFIPGFATELQRARTHDYQIGLALMSVDAFRKYLDTYGIDEAHALLAEVVAVTKEKIRDMDLLARFSADQFILCLSGVTADEMASRLAEITSSILEKVVGKGDISVSVVIGSLHLRSEAELKENVQHIISALGKKLVEAKSKSSSRKIR